MVYRTFACSVYQFIRSPKGIFKIGPYWIWQVDVRQAIIIFVPRKIIRNASYIPRFMLFYAFSYLLYRLYLVIFSLWKYNHVSTSFIVLHLFSFEVHRTYEHTLALT